MITAIVRFSLPKPMSAEDAQERFSASALKFQEIDGLQRKHFLRSADGTIGGGGYLWDSQDKAEAFYTTEWSEDMSSKFGETPIVEFFEIPVTVDLDSITSETAASVRRFIAAPTATVFSMVTDITRMGEWSPELVSAEWSDGFDAPAVGARYVGHNRLGDLEWSIENQIVELVDGERFTWESFSPSDGKAFANWGYIFESVEGGCLVTEWTKDFRSAERRAKTAAATGVADRGLHNKHGMTVTLDRLASACEAA